MCKPPSSGLLSYYRHFVTGNVPDEPQKFAGNHHGNLLGVLAGVQQGSIAPASPFLGAPADGFGLHMCGALAIKLRQKFIDFGR